MIIARKTFVVDNLKVVEIVAPLKYSNFWITLEISLINSKIIPIPIWSVNCVNTNSTGARTFAITDAKLYVRVVTLLNQDNAKLLQRLKSSFKRRINRNKYESKVTTQAQNQYLDYLIDPSFQIVNILVILSFKHNVVRTRHTGYFLLKVEIKDHNVMIDEANVLYLPVKNNVRTYDNIHKIRTGQRDDYITLCLLG